VAFRFKEKGSCERKTLDLNTGRATAKANQEGNEMPLRRVNEINAIAELKDVTDPVNTIKSAPKGIMKFMNRAGESIKSIGKKKDNEDSEPDGSKLKDIIGFNGTKRKVALSLGVPRILFSLESQLDLPCFRRSVDGSTDHQLDRASESMSGVITASAMFSQTPL
jgi:hypothetical protein